MEYREEVHEKIQQKKVRYLLRMKNGGAVQQREAKKDGYLQRMQQELPMKEQAVRIVSTRHVVSLLQSIATWEQLSEKEKEQWHKSQAMREESPKLG